MRSTTWINRQAGRVLGGWVRLLLMLVLAGLIAVLLVRPPHSTNSFNGSALATELATALAAQSGVSAATGSYLPGTGVVVVSGVSGTLTAGSVEGLLGGALGPVKQQVAELPSGEAVVWQVTSGSSWLVRVPSGDVADTSKWTVVPETAGQSAVVAATTAGGSAQLSGSAAQAVTGASAASPTSAAAVTGMAATGATSAATTTSAASATRNRAAQPATGAAGSSAAAAGKVAGPFTDHFAKNDSSWQPLVGEWKIKKGTYQQSQTNGYDLISAYNGTVPTSYTVSVRFRGLGTTSNAGLVLGLPQLGSRIGGTLVDLANQNYLRWGKYDTTNGNYSFIGGVTLGATASAGAWQALAVQVTPTGCAVLWNGKKVGTFTAISSGYVGLATSQSAAEFDDFTVTTK